jgi:hypothetical protein
VLAHTRESLIEESIHEASKAEFERRIAAGQYEVIHDGGVYTSPHYNPYDVYWVMGGQGLDSRKVSLPEAEYLDVFKQRALCTWLFNESHEREYAADHPKQAAPK